MKHAKLAFILLAGFGSTAALAVPGEWWEITSKMEMAGMPFAMPATTVRVCVAKEAATDPRQTMQDKDCKMTDIKTSGNKTTWKMRCVHDGEVMNGSGEFTGTASAYQGTTRLTGKSGGEKIDMITSYRGKRVGPACDSAQLPSK